MCEGDGPRSSPLNLLGVEEGLIGGSTYRAPDDEAGSPKSPSLPRPLLPVDESEQLWSAYTNILIAATLRGLLVMYTRLDIDGTCLRDSANIAERGYRS